MAKVEVNDRKSFVTGNKMHRKGHRRDRQRQRKVKFKV